MPEYFFIQSEPGDAGATLRAVGELDVASAPDLERAASESFDGQERDFRLDMSGLTFMDSTGAQALLHIHNAVEGRGRHIAFMVPRAPVRDVLGLLGLDQVLDVTPA